MGSATSFSIDHVRILVSEALTIPLPDNDLDLVTHGLMDSLAVVTLITEIEDRLQIALPLDTLDVDHFRSVSQITAYLATLPSPGS